MVNTSIIKHSNGGSLILQLITFDNLMNELISAGVGRPLFKYDFNKFFKVYSTFPRCEVPVLPSDLETTNFIQSVIEGGDDNIIKIILQRGQMTYDPVAYLVRANSSLTRHEATTTTPNGANEMKFFPNSSSQSSSIAGTKRSRDDEFIDNNKNNKGSSTGSNEMIDMYVNGEEHHVIEVTEDITDDDEGLHLRFNELMVRFIDVFIHNYHY